MVSSIASSSEPDRAELMNDLEFLNAFVRSNDQTNSIPAAGDNSLPLPDPPSQKCLSLESVHEDAKVSA